MNELNEIRLKIVAKLEFWMAAEILDYGERRKKEIFIFARFKEGEFWVVKDSPFEYRIIMKNDKSGIVGLINKIKFAKKTREIIWLIRKEETKKIKFKTWMGEIEG